MTILVVEGFTLISMVKVDSHKFYSTKCVMFEGSSKRNPSACLRVGYRWHLDIKNGMSIASLNINCCRCHFEEAQLLLEIFGVHALALNEIKLDPKCMTELPIILGYEHEQRKRTSRGGISVYIRETVKYTWRYDLPRNDFELK